MKDYVARLPKAELHVHLEGTLEPEHIFELANRNGIELEYTSVDELIKAYDFYDLPSFLKIYYAGMHVLQTEQDFYELTWRYFEKAKSQNIVYVEPFFDPQGHTSRGVAFETVISGIHKAQIDAKEKLGVDSQLILCFLRDMSAESAMEHLQMALPYKEWIIGVGLDSDEKDNPPSKFAGVFAKARQAGFNLTMHCDVHQKDIHDHIRECVDLIGVDRIDHGINCLDQQDLIDRVKNQKLGLTICPVSNKFVCQTHTTEEIRKMLQLGLKPTINSDDPAYFRAYLNENFYALVDEDAFTKKEIDQLVINSFEVSWLSDGQKLTYLTQLSEVIN